MNDMPRFSTFDPAPAPPSTPHGVGACWRSPGRPAACCSTARRWRWRRSIPIRRSRARARSAARSRCASARPGSSPTSARCGWTRRGGTAIIAEIDFLGEGDEERLTGKLYNFRRGVTRYPSPGAEVFPVTTPDLKQVYAADDRAHVGIGTVYPTKDIRATLYVDAMLGKHFALVGSTGTGKSTSAALILHRICDLGAAGPHRHDRPARRVFRGVQGQRRAPRRRPTCRCPIG